MVPAGPGGRAAVYVVVAGGMNGVRRSQHEHVRRFDGSRTYTVGAKKRGFMQGFTGVCLWYSSSRILGGSWEVGRQQMNGAAVLRLQPITPVFRPENVCLTPA